MIPDEASLLPNYMCGICCPMIEPIVMGECVCCLALQAISGIHKLDMDVLRDFPADKLQLTRRMRS